MREQQERRPEYCRTNSKVVIEVTSAGSKEFLRLAVFIETRLSETCVRTNIVPREIEAVLD
jgi:hypothetical protein